MSSANKTRGQHSMLLLSVAAGLFVFGASPAMAANVTLCAEPYVQSLPGPVSVAMWGYRQVAAAADCASPGTAASPGPVITVPASDTSLAITLVNKLTVPTSIVLAGQALASDGGAPVRAADVVGLACAEPTTDAVCRVRSFTGETDVGATRTYTFSALKPGTYLYQSGTHPQVQIQMGLFGMVKQDATLTGVTGRLLYASAAAGFDVDLPVVLSEIDPAQHALIQGTLGSSLLADQQRWNLDKNSTLNYAPSYFLINGRVFDSSNPATSDLAAPNAGAGARTVLRLANAGLKSRTLMLNSGTWTLLTEDGYPYAAGREQASALLPANKTSDALLISTAPIDGSISRSLAIFDRRGGTDNADGSALGGQVARLAQSGPALPLIAPIAAQVANEGSTFTLQVSGANVTSYSLTGLAGATLSASGLISWPVPTGTVVPTSYAVTVVGSGTGSPVPAPAVSNFNVRINHTPTIAATGPIAVAHGTRTIAAPGALAGAADPDGDTPLTVVLTSAASAGALALSTDGSYTWTGAQPAIGTPPVAVTFSVAARDPYGLTSAATTVTLNVAANSPPTAIDDANATTTRETITLARALGVPLARSITPNPLNLATQPIANLQFALQDIIGNDTDTDGRVVTLQVTGVTRGTVSATGVFTAVLLPGTPPLIGGTWAEASVTLVSAGDGTGVITFVPRTRTNTISGSVVVGFPTGTLLSGGALQTSLGVYRVQYRAVDDQGALSATSATFYVRVQ